MPVHRITNPLSSRSGYQRRKGYSIVLWGFCLTSFVVVAIYFLQAGSGDVAKEHYQPVQQQKQTGQVSSVAAVKSESIHTTLTPQSHDANDDYNNDDAEAKDEEKGSVEGIVGAVTLSTIAGVIHIKLRPDLSRPSVEYILSLTQSSKSCDRCRFYRAEKPGILQGMLSKESVKPNEVLGECPEEYRNNALATGMKDCPEWDKNCGCHGPIMTRGMVAWAGGGTGPDFFIDMYKKEAKHWENQHTVWGEVVDEESLAVIDHIFDLEVKNLGGMHMLKKTLHIDISES